MNAGLALLTMFPGRVGGTETYVRGLVAAFDAGHGPGKTTLLLSDASVGAMTPFASDRVAVETINAFAAGSSALTRFGAIALALTYPQRLTKALPDGLDLMHYPVTIPIPTAPDLPSVVTLADVQHRDLPKLFSPAERAFRRRTYDDAARNATRIITISEFSADRIIELLDVPPEQVTAIHHGIDHELFNPKGPRSAIPGLPERYVYYPANPWPHKNHQRLLEAFSLVNDPELHLVFTGHGHVPLPGDSEKRILRLGQVPKHDLPGLYRQAVGLVFPSLYEGFGFPPVEAMACGCPVAASGIGAIAEVCGDAALLFDPTDPEAIAEAISRVASDSTLRSELSLAGTTRAAQFTWRRSAERHLEVYRAAVASSGRD